MLAGSLFLSVRLKRWRLLYRMKFGRLVAHGVSHLEN